MFLSQLIVINYRSCKSVSVEFDDSQPNILIGVNDCGKSTILKAAKLLFDEKPVYKFITNSGKQQDISNSPLSEQEYSSLMSSHGLPLLPYSSSETIIIGRLSLEEDDSEENYIDYSEHLRVCRQLALDHHIWLLRAFCSNSGNVISYLLCKKHECDEQALWALGEPKLKVLNQSFEINDGDINNVNNTGKPSKYERIVAIYSKTESSLPFTWEEYKFEKKDRPAFPEFRYLDWTCSLDDIKKQANDLLSDKITTAFEEIKREVERKALELENEVNNELRESLLSELMAVVPSLTGITAKLSPAEILPKISDILVEKNTSDSHVHIESQGEGIKRQIWYGLLKAQARRLAGSSTRKEYIWAFDEPETHLYPGAQREFFDLLRNAANGGIQIILSTHSTIFVDKTNLRELKKISLQDGYSEVSICQDPQDVHTTLQVRNSDFLFHDKFLVVEGESEVALVPHMYRVHTGRTLQQDNIQLVDLGGADKWQSNQKLFASIMADFKKDSDLVVYVFDKDQQSKMDANLQAYLRFYLGVQDMEDSIDTSVWVKVVNEYFDEREAPCERITTEDIESIKRTITSASTNRNDKFVEKLGSFIASLQREQEPKVYLPGKPELSKRICRHIVSMDQICSQLKDAFDALSENNADLAVNQLLNEAGVEVEQ